MEFDKNFLKEIQKKNKKKSKDKHAWGWFQNRNAGIVPYNNAMFNMMMGSSDSASDISGMGTADGGIGSVGTISGGGDSGMASGGGMGESYQLYESNTAFTMDTYKSSMGNDDITDFLDNDLSEIDRAHVERDLEELRKLGNMARKPLSTFLRDNIYELRTFSNIGTIRILYTFSNGKIILLLRGFIKKTRKTPNDEIEIAIKRRKDYINRNGGN